MTHSYGLQSSVPAESRGKAYSSIEAQTTILVLDFNTGLQGHKYIGVLLKNESPCHRRTLCKRWFWNPSFQYFLDVAALFTYVAQTLMHRNCRCNMWYTHAFLQNYSAKAGQGRNTSRTCLANMSTLRGTYSWNCDKKKDIEIWLAWQSLIRFLASSANFSACQVLP